MALTGRVWPSELSLQVPSEFLLPLNNRQVLLFITYILRIYYVAQAVPQLTILPHPSECWIKCLCPCSWLLFPSFLLLLDLSLLLFFFVLLLSLIKGLSFLTAVFLELEEDKTVTRSR